MPGLLVCLCQLEFFRISGTNGATVEAKMAGLNLEVPEMTTEHRRRIGFNCYSHVKRVQQKRRVINVINCFSHPDGSIFGTFQPGGDKSGLWSLWWVQFWSLPELPTLPDVKPFSQTYSPNERWYRHSATWSGWERGFTEWMQEVDLYLCLHMHIDHILSTTVPSKVDTWFTSPMSNQILVQRSSSRPRVPEDRGRRQTNESVRSTGSKRQEGVGSWEFRFLHWYCTWKGWVLFSMRFLVSFPWPIVSRPRQASRWAAQHLEPRLRKGTSMENMVQMGCLKERMSATPRGSSHFALWRLLHFFIFRLVQAHSGDGGWGRLAAWKFSRSYHTTSSVEFCCVPAFSYVGVSHDIVGFHDCLFDSSCTTPSPW